MLGVEIRLLDDDGTPVAPGQAGEIWSRGPDLCVGYTDPTLHDGAFDDDGWYRTGDMGVLDDDGFLTITDRLNDVIIRGGENLSAAEIEEAIATLPQIAEVAVVAAPDARLGEHACAIVRLAPDATSIELRDITEQLDAHRARTPEVARGAARRLGLPAHGVRARSARSTSVASCEPALERAAHAGCRARRD